MFKVGVQAPNFIPFYAIIIRDFKLCIFVHHHKLYHNSKLVIQEFLVGFLMKP